MGAYTKIFNGEPGETKKLRVTITLSTIQRPYKHLRYFSVVVTGNERKFNTAYRAYRKMFDK